MSGVSPPPPPPPPPPPFFFSQCARLNVSVHLFYSRFFSMYIFTEVNYIMYILRVIFLHVYFYRGHLYVHSPCYFSPCIFLQGSPICTFSVSFFSMYIFTGVTYMYMHRVIFLHVYFYRGHLYVHSPCSSYSSSFASDVSVPATASLA